MPHPPNVVTVYIGINDKTKNMCDLLEDKIAEGVVYFVSHDFINLRKKGMAWVNFWVYIMNECFRLQFTM